MEHIHQGEAPKPTDIYSQIKSYHEEFYSQVPNYDRRIWSPQEALKLKTGGCMAELLFVAGGLLHDGVLSEQDMSIRFSKEHGKMVSSNMMGSQKPDFKHAVLMLKIYDKQYECDFRLYRADEKPQFETVQPDDAVYKNPNIEFFTLADGITQYASRVGVQQDQIPTVAEIVSLHNPRTTTFESDQIRFDEEF